MEKFKINILYSKNNSIPKPEVSFKLINYIEEFFIKNVFEPKKIILNAKTNILLQITIFTDHDLTYIKSLPFSIYKNENIKAFPIMICIKDRISKTNDINVEFAMILYEAITEFLATHFKKVCKEELETLKIKLDINYLSSIIYPAPLIQQNFV